MSFVPVTDLAEQLAVFEAEIDGDLYKDGEVWANKEALERWRATPKTPDFAFLSAQSAD